MVARAGGSSCPCSSEGLLEVSSIDDARRDAMRCEVQTYTFELLYLYYFLQITSHGYLVVYYPQILQNIRCYTGCN